MTLETLFAKFNLFADAPGAVAKVRELVLELAVRGRLIAPASSEQSDSTGPFQIPAHWRWSTLSAAADCRASAKVSPAEIADTAWVLDLEDIEGTTGQIIQVATFAERRSLSTKAAFEAGDVLYGKLRPYLNKVVVAERCGYCTTEIVPLRPTPAVSSEFLRLYLRSQTFLRFAAEKNYGMKMPRLGTKDLESADIPLPPLVEQKRIVAKVDELMALCDRLEAQQQEREERHAVLARAALARFADAPTPANLQLLFHGAYAISPAEIRKAILALAVQGKLVAGTEARDVALGEVIELLSGQHLLAHEQNDAERGIPYLTGPSDFGERHPVPKRWTETPKVVAEPGDILITVKGAGVGKTNKLRAERTAISRQLMAVRVTGADPDFVHLVLMNAVSHFQEAMTGIAIPGIGRSDVLGLRATLPPLAEQRRIVAKVDELMALVDQLEVQLAASRATAAKLLDAVVVELTAARQP